MRKNDYYNILNMGHLSIIRHFRKNFMNILHSFIEFQVFSTSIQNDNHFYLTIVWVENVEQVQLCSSAGLIWVHTYGLSMGIGLS